PDRPPTPDPEQGLVVLSGDALEASRAKVGIEDTSEPFDGVPADRHVVAGRYEPRRERPLDPPPVVHRDQVDVVAPKPVWWRERPSRERASPHRPDRRIAERSQQLVQPSILH